MKPNEKCHDLIETVTNIQTGYFEAVNKKICHRHLDLFQYSSNTDTQRLFERLIQGV